MNQDDDFDTILELTARLQLQDIEEWRDLQKGKGRIGTVSSTELSLNAIENHHKTVLQNLADRRIAQSVQRAVTEDRELIEALKAVEEQERADRQLALRLSVTLNAQQAAPAPAPAVYANPSRISTISGRSEMPSSSSVASYPSSINSLLGHMSMASSTTSVNTAYKLPINTSSFVPSILKLAGGRPTVDCIICTDTVTQAYHAPCGCFYDRDCLTELFQKATIDESLFPPRCCNQPISFQEVRVLFSPQLVRAFEQKTEEFKTTNRLYCHNSTCSAFLGPAVGNERMKTSKQCTQCYLQTCTFCKAAGHGSYIPCPTDVGAQQVLTLGRREGWQSCPSCHHVVELSFGCYHMTCRCRHQFCYLCAQQWKSCTCPQWDETRLVAQAQQQVVRNQGVPPQVAATRLLDVRRVADALRANHACAHHTYGFTKQNNGGNCESCGTQSRSFLLRCRGCAIQVCVHCRRNRL